MATGRDERGSQIGKARNAGQPSPQVIIFCSSFKPWPVTAGSQKDFAAVHRRGVNNARAQLEEELDLAIGQGEVFRCPLPAVVFVNVVYHRADHANIRVLLHEADLFLKARGVMNVIGVRHRDQGRGTLPKATVPGIDEAPVGIVPQRLDPGVPLRVAGDNSPCVVRAAVVNDDELVIRKGLRAQAGEAGPDEPADIVGGHANTHHGTQLHLKSVVRYRSFNLEFGAPPAS